MSATIIKQLIDAAGSQSAFGREIGAAPALVWQWADERRPVSPKFARRIEERYGVSRHDLRPDVFGPPPEGQGGEAWDAA